MDKLSEIKLERERLERQLAELRNQESRLNREAKSLINVDDHVFITKGFQDWYEMELQFKCTDESLAKNMLRSSTTCIISPNKKDLETEMLCLIQRLLDATIQLSQLDG